MSHSRPKAASPSSACVNADCARSTNISALPPIPVLNWSQTTSSYRDIPFDSAHSRANEPLVDLSDYNIAGESYYARKDGKNTPYNKPLDGSLRQIWVRQSIADMLGEVNKLLAPYEVEIFALDGYRTIACQQALWNFFDEYISQNMPHAPREEQIKALLSYVSDPRGFDANDSTTWPVHSTGGAIDVTLRALKSGVLCDMGAEFDTMSEVSHSDYFERALESGEITETEPALMNRRVLHWAMKKAGFVNYPLEFWHFDWGDRMYVKNLDLLTQMGYGYEKTGFEKTGYEKSGTERPQKAWYGTLPAPAAS